MTVMSTFGSLLGKLEARLIPVLVTAVFRLNCIYLRVVRQRIFLMRDMMLLLSHGRIIVSFDARKRSP